MFITVIGLQLLVFRFVVDICSKPLLESLGHYLWVTMILFSFWPYSIRLLLFGIELQFILFDLGFGLFYFTWFDYYREGKLGDGT